MTKPSPAAKWKHDGVRVIPAHALDPNTAQTAGMDRKAGVHAPPRAVAIPRAVKARAMPRSDSTPLR
jgi:hypothetical protein